ncbi:RNA 2',3'-cyclic phosphodiesterase [Halomarina oriensis]|uniref:RNA 2',3'-cyclic phosphodiesterase n=1 Tax=Halomarina oriensis TaxID=671145 RepID=A0A6B0GQH4_9EURY|nr:RNA 2',3'-cyclic phosphodiesterase [Halomarina oriensis]MWG34375.1 RNA 2',3'-cyclic phosphodiesterase [Halomarina oriensis]
MRAFVGVDCAPVSEAVAAAQEPFRGLDGLGPTDPGQAHVTLQFLGDVDETLAEAADESTGAASATDHDGPTDAVPGLDTLVSALDSAVAGSGVSPFDCTLGGYGTFPEGDSVSVVWLGVEEGTAELTRLAAAVELATTSLGFAPDGHDFTPHVTLARTDHAADREQVRRIVAESAPDSARFRVDTVHLVESTLTPDGPVYDSVARLPL